MLNAEEKTTTKATMLQLFKEAVSVLHFADDLVVGVRKSAHHRKTLESPTAVTH